MYTAPKASKASSNPVDLATLEAEFRTATAAAEAAQKTNLEAHARELSSPNTDTYRTTEIGIILRGLRAEALEAGDAAGKARARLMRALDRPATEALVADLRGSFDAIAALREQIAEHESTARARLAQAGADREVEILRRQAAGLPSVEPVLYPTIEEALGRAEARLTTEPEARSHADEIRKLRARREEAMAFLETKRIEAEEAADLAKRQAKWDRQQAAAAAVRREEDRARERERHAAEMAKRKALADAYAARTGIARPA